MEPIFGALNTELVLPLSLCGALLEQLSRLGPRSIQSRCCPTAEDHTSVAGNLETVKRAKRLTLFWREIVGHDRLDGAKELEDGIVLVRFLGHKQEILLGLSAGRILESCTWRVTESVEEGTVSLEIVQDDGRARNASREDRLVLQ